MADAPELSTKETAFFRALEERLFEPGVRGSLEQAGRLLADEFVEFGSDGSVCSRADILDWLQTEVPSKRALSDFRAVQLADGAVLVTYRSTRRSDGDSGVRHSLRSSIWKESDGEWRMLFHQGTALPGA